MKNIQFFCLFLLTFLNANAQKNYWTDTNFEELSIRGTQYIFPDQFRSSHLAYDEMKNLLFKAPLQDLSNKVFHSPIEIMIPLPDGTNEIFRIVSSPVYEEGLLDNFPGIKTFLAYCPNHPEWYSRFDITPQGFHGMILGTEQGTVFIDPVTHLGFDKEDYLIYYKKNFNRKNESLLCYLDDKAPINQPPNTGTNSGTYKMLGSCDLRTYRLAVSATGEYTAFHGGTVAGALAAQLTTMNRVNGVFERDMAIHMNIIANNNLIVYTNAATDPFTNGTPGTMINQNQTNTTAVIGSANYDIGHVFGTNSGGLAQLQSPCGGSKARGVTGSSAPVGDPFDIDYVAHEMGHQFGANHTQNNSCNRNNATAMEPGSASTIMGYAGICAPNVQSNSDDYFHGISMQEIGNFITGTGNSCAVNTPLSNTAPSVSLAATTYNIPASTPFSLTAFATDPNASNTLTYCWEQMNSTAATMPPVATATAGPSFRSFDPSTSPTRYFPNLPAIIAGTTPTWEVLSSVGRVMNFRVVVRDNSPGGGCNDHEDLTVTIIGTAGPFLVTAPNSTGITWAGNTNQTVTWNVASTASAPISCANVNILISYDGGLTFPDTIASNVPNDGSQSIVVPNIATTNALIIVQCANGTFFDVSNNTFTITAITNDFTFTAANSNDTVCVNENASYTLSVGVLGAFTNNITLSTSGLPAAFSTSFSSNNLPPSYGSNLTIGNTGSVAPGTYNFTIQANSSSGTKTINASLVIIPNLSGSLNLTSPLNNSAGISTPATLTWSAISGTSYSIIIADNASLSNVIENSANFITNSYTTSPLAPNTTYYWMVSAYTFCDTLSSSVFSFTTANCVTYTSTNIPIAISASGTPTITSNLSITGSIGTINDVNVISLSGTHTYINDLIFTLTSPNGTDVILLNRICGNQNNFNIQFDDSAPNNTYPCPPTSGGTFIPEESLSAFNGENANGAWVLTIEDVFNNDGGSLNAWGIEICFDSPISCSTLFDTTQLSTCDSAQVNGTWYSNSQLINDSLIASNGCDSIHTVNLTINNSSPETIINQTTCIASSAGSSSATFTNTAGCDSMVTTNTTLLIGGTGTSNSTACDSSLINGQWYFASITFNNTLVGASSNGCDSIVTYNLTINNSVNTNENNTACDSAQVNGTWYFSSQVLTQNLTTTNSCDSIHTVNLTINNRSPETIINQTTCIASSAGSSSATFTNTAGCDSMVTTNTTLLIGGTGTSNSTACDSSLINGQWYFASITFNNTLVGASSNGCDSIVTYNLTINNSVNTNENYAACDSAQVNGTWYFVTQNIIVNAMTSSGCDSIHTISINIGNSTSSIDVQSACNSYTWIDGNSYTSSTNSPSTTIGNAAGCDSIVTLSLIITNTVTGIDNQSACESYTWIDGNTYITSTNTPTFTIPGGAINGCDSIAALDLTINYNAEISNVLNACDSYTWIDGVTYTDNVQNVTYVVQGATASGCDSIYILDLNILSSDSDTDVVVACGSYTWIDSLNYTSSNNTSTYVNLGGAANGCAVFIFLDLTILPLPIILIVNNNGILEATAGLGSYQWYRNGLLLPGETSSTLIPLLNDVYTCLTNNGTCDGLSNEIVINVSSIQDPAFQNVSIYPNPSNNILNIDLGTDEVSSIRLIDLNGKIVCNLDVKEQQFDMSAYARGMYFIELLNEEQRAIVKLVLN